MILTQASTRQRRRSVGRRVAIGLLWCCAAAELQAASYSVSQVQAAFLFNFAQFVKWPARAFTGPDAPLVIGVLGANPFGAALENTVVGEVVDGHRIAVKYSRRAEDLKSCQIVFIGQSEAGQIGSALSTFEGNATLTASEIPGFCQQGGMIQFVLDGGKVRFSINTQAAKSAGLQISSKLLKLAKSVEN